MKIAILLRRTAAIAAVLLGATAFGLSMTGEDLRMRFHTHGPLHPYIHVALFAVLALLAMQASRRRRTRGWLLAAVFALGLTIEIAEAIRFGQGFEPRDVLTDLMGTILGAVLVGIFERPAPLPR